MPRITIRNAGDIPFGPFPEIPGVEARGSIQSKSVIGTAEQPMWCWLHQLAPGAEMRWSKPAVAHGIFVWEGSIEANGRSYGIESAAIIEYLEELYPQPPMIGRNAVERAHVRSATLMFPCVLTPREGAEEDRTRRLQFMREK